MATAAERKRTQRQRAKDGAPTAERLRKELYNEFTLQVARYCNGLREAGPTCSEVIETIAARYSREYYVRILHYFGWPYAELDGDEGTLRV